MRRFALFALAGTLALAACHRAPVEPEELNNSANAAAPHNATAPAPPPPATNATERPAPPLNFTDAAQMRDDADATGLTARVQREGDTPAAPAPAPAPAQ